MIAAPPPEPSILSGARRGMLQGRGHGPQGRSHSPTWRQGLGYRQMAVLVALQALIVLYYVTSCHLRTTVPREVALPLGAYNKERSAPFDLVIGLSHHKSGTGQLGCILFNAAKGAGIPEPLYVNDEARIENMTAYLASLGVKPHRPAIFATGHVLWSQVCYTQSQAGAAVQCPWRAPCKCTDDACTEFRNTLEIGNCVFHLPALDVALVHTVRNPIDVVVSAYLYHSQDRTPEGWLSLEAKYYSGIVGALGVDPEPLEELGFSTAPANVTFGQLLQSLPPDQGVELEFWRSLPELYDMARQYSVLLRHPSHLAVPTEQLRDEFNATTLVLLETVFPTHRPDRLLSEVQRCDLATWTEAQHKQEPEMRAHVTSHHDPEMRANLAKHLLSVQAIREHLCHLAHVLDYHLDQRCMAQGVTT